MSTLSDPYRSPPPNTIPPGCKLLKYDLETIAVSFWFYDGEELFSIEYTFDSTLPPPNKEGVVEWTGTPSPDLARNKLHSILTGARDRGWFEHLDNKGIAWECFRKYEIVKTTTNHVEILWKHIDWY